MKTYKVSVSNIFDADNHREAVMQFALWLEEYARHAGYRVEGNGESEFIDATFLFLDE